MVKIAFSLSEHIKFLILHKWKERLAAMQIYQNLVSGRISCAPSLCKVQRWVDQFQIGETQAQATEWPASDSRNQGQY